MTTEYQPLASKSTSLALQKYQLHCLLFPEAFKTLLDLVISSSGANASEFEDTISKFFAEFLSELGSLHLTMLQDLASLLSEKSKSGSLQKRLFLKAARDDYMGFHKLVVEIQNELASKDSKVATEALSDSKAILADHLNELFHFNYTPPKTIYHKLDYANGDSYEGEWLGGKRWGRGKYSTKDGDVYEGNFKNGEMDGYIRYKGANGDVYEGQYQDGLRSGHGRFTWASGDYYQGEWKAGKEHGRGRYLGVQGDFGEGEYKEGVNHGLGRCRYKNGNVYEGEFVEGKRQGRGRMVYKSLEVEYDGEWKEGMRHGRGVLFKFNERVKQAVWKKDKLLREEEVNLDELTGALDDSEDEVEIEEDEDEESGSEESEDEDGDEEEADEEGEYESSSSEYADDLYDDSDDERRGRDID